MYLKLGCLMISWFLRVMLPMLLALPASSLAQPALQDRWPTADQQKQMQIGLGATRPPKQTATPPQIAQAPKRAEPQHVVACSGVFAKDSNHLKLATTFEAQNITYGEVDGAEGTKLMASILYPKDPKRRLEILWDNEAARSDLSVISINGQSTWVAPKGLKLGMSLVAIERLNGKPFKLSGFDWDYGGRVSDWMGGALATLLGGCAMGTKLAPDPKTSDDVRRQVAGKREFESSDPLMRAAKPTVEEITIGYPQ